LVIVSIVSARTYTQGYLRPLTRSIADTLYCNINGFCSLESIETTNNVNASDFCVVTTNGTKRYCVQESANDTSTCGGLGTGTYWNESNWVNISKAYDGDYDTWAISDNPAIQLWINYTKHPEADGAVWQIKDDTDLRNVTVPDVCWNAFTNTLSFTAYSDLPSNGFVRWYCINENKSDGGFALGRLFEEAVFWNITEDSCESLDDRFCSPDNPLDCPINITTNITNYITNNISEGKEGVNYLYNDTSNMYLNESILNRTIKYQVNQSANYTSFDGNLTITGRVIRIVRTWWYNLFVKYKDLEDYWNMSDTTLAVVNLTPGSEGQVIKTTGGQVVWGTDNTGNGTGTGNANETAMRIYIGHSMTRNVRWNISQSETKNYRFKIVKNGKIFPIGGEIQ
jgi:hypothetical protein